MSLLQSIMETIAARLKTVEGLRVHEQPPKTIVPPAGIVSYPESIDYDQTYRQGMTRVSGLKVWLVVGNVTERSTRDRLAAYVAESGEQSVKAALEAEEDGLPWDVLQVGSVEFDVITIGSVDYMAAGFSIDLACQGGT